MLHCCFHLLYSEDTKWISLRIAQKPYWSTFQHLSSSHHHFQSAKMMWGCISKLYFNYPAYNATWRTKVKKGISIIIESPQTVMTVKELCFACDCVSEQSLRHIVDDGEILAVFIAGNTRYFQVRSQLFLIVLEENFISLTGSNRMRKWILRDQIPQAMKVKKLEFCSRLSSKSQYLADSMKSKH